MALPRFSFGVGDRFAHQAAAQLAAFERLAAEGVIVAPVWNKSNREHTFIGSEPEDVRVAASRAVAQRRWAHPWFVDADHIDIGPKQLADCKAAATTCVREAGRTAVFAESPLGVEFIEAHARTVVGHHKRISA